MAGLRRCLVIAIPAALIVIHADSSALLRAQQPVFRSNTDVVAVDVAVHDGNKPVAELAAPDFELRDNGVVQSIAAITFGTLPIDVRLLVDLSSSIKQDQLTRQQAAMREVQAALTPDDRCEVSSFARRIVEVAELQTPPVRTALRRPELDGTSYFDAATLSMITVSRPGRRQLTMLLTDGLDNRSFFNQATLIDAAKRTDAVVFIVVASPRQGNAGTGPAPRAPVPLTNVASPTGGQVVMIGSGGDVGPALAKIVAEFRQTYSLNYTPANVPREGWHAITVTVPKHKAYTIRARQGYFGG
jgi:VWFA-related protein